MGTKQVQITQAYNRWARMYERWHFERYGVYIRVSAPHVNFDPSSKKFEINGLAENGTGDQIIQRYNLQAQRYHDDLPVNTESADIPLLHAPLDREYGGAK